MGTAVALGNFDGVSKAHAGLIQQMVKAAKERGLRAGVYLLEPHPRTQLVPENPIRLITPLPKKIWLIEQLGVDFVEVEKRGKLILELSPEQFVQNILQKELDAKYVMAGFNYRFGKHACGDAALLQSICAKCGIVCEIFPSVTEGGAPISSTRLRNLLSIGDIESVNRFSFAPYSIGGIVKEGKHLGRTIGFPTINIPIEKDVFLPKKGVYISRTRVDGEIYNSITNIGENPTVEHADIRMESHLFDYTGDAYGQKAETTLLKFVRAEQAFRTTEALKAQITADVKTAILYFEGEKQQ